MLRSLGFSQDEVFRVQLDDGLRPFIKCEWYSEEGYFCIDTGVRPDVALNDVGIRSGEPPLLRERDGFSVHHVDSFSLLGRNRPEGEVTVFPTESEGNVFGSLGAKYFENRVLAFDPAEPAVGVTDRDWHPAGRNWTRLSLAGTSELPVTADIRFADESGHGFLTLLSSGTRSSLVGPASDHPDERRALKLGDALLEVALDVGELPEYAVPLGGNLGLVLGSDVLCRFLTVFDFRARAIWMMSYPGAI